MFRAGYNCSLQRSGHVTFARLLNLEIKQLLVPICILLLLNRIFRQNFVNIYVLTALLHYISREQKSELYTVALSTCLMEMFFSDTRNVSCLYAVESFALV